ncbi:MAG: hypothetical protein NC432_15355, partial [Roseburia sp.]|nr:hypothetical protein [Roseburia sp.]MCM1098307.1 hypothetical protein [Ruminococcus flavefaciens]
YLQFVWNEEKGREEADMCYALEQILKKERKQGVKEGKREGKLEGKQEGKLEGKQEGLKEGIKKGIKEGIRQGEMQGRQRISKLLELLLAEGRLEDLPRVATDERFQRKLLKEYGI